MTVFTIGGLPNSGIKNRPGDYTIVDPISFESTDMFYM